MNQNLDIRKLSLENIDLMVNTFQFTWSDHQMTNAKWQNYYKEQKKQIRDVYVVYKENIPIAYGSLVYFSSYSYFLNNQIPEINDIWVSSDWRGQSIATQLISYLENLAMGLNYNTIGLGVGLYSDYGPAQRLYYKLGYKPDGNGITYNYTPIIPGDSYAVDDSLILWLIKSLK